MKIAAVNNLNIDPQVSSIRAISTLMNDLPVNRIDTINWPSFPYKPDVQFSIGYSGSEIYIKFFVKEEYFRAEVSEPNGNVYEDSCVEFFISPEDDGIYYNFEFNARGICLMGSGKGRQDRIRSDISYISKIRTSGSFSGEHPGIINGRYEWELTIAIPSEVFFHNRVGTIRNSEMRANFYKCGDKVKVPHYLTWNPVNTTKPDFHRPESFGLLNFR
ncbi:MAG TPA: carbohydrate-binding family 9-like protein [Bacteroidales bacterium]|nr:carbohydrate-binding family 9-like protein [Bacteroidales bacterium]